MTAYDNWKADAPEPGIDIEVFEAAIGTVTAQYVESGYLMDELLTSLYQAGPAINEVLSLLDLGKPLGRDLSDLAQRLAEFRSAVDSECVLQTTYQEKDDE